jgi:hypothetical protein
VPGPPRLRSLPRRRRPAFVALGVALVAACAAGGTAMLAHAGARTEVLAIARTVPVGAVITSADLTPARVDADPALAPIPAAQQPSVLGQRAAVELRPGTLLTRGELTTTGAPSAGQQVLGVVLKPGQLPAQGVTPGARVLLIGTPSGGTGSATDGSGAATVRVAAMVRAVTTTAGSGGDVVVDLLVADSDGTAAAQAASTGHVALLLQPAAGGG